MLIPGMLFFVGSLSLHAQSHKLKRSHAISLPSAQQSAVPATGTLNVIGIMVEFQPDDNRLTSGTGIFGTGGLPYLENEEVTYIDPLPHDQVYFETHLEFAKNYFEQASDGQLTIDYRVLPDIYRVDKKMEEYAPIGETFTLEKVAMLLEDAWAEVEENGGFDASGLDPDNTAFVIFHAGVGRDVELTGTSLDITPYDIPSIYLKKADLKDLLEDPSFEGFPINGGSFRVTNSMVIPRTESRRGEDIQENEIVFPLSINGLLCASIGSHLGLPDLFNTTTGEPAIGRFGLMDGAGFFAFNGLLPPQPSAWEKVFLGWETPFVINDMTGLINLPAGSQNQPNSIAKYELSSSEYFLIENRYREYDLNSVGRADVTISIRRALDGQIVQQQFSNDDLEFIFQEAGFDTLLIPGTFVDVNNFDWSLPGGLDIGADEEEGTEDDRYLNGGILIWHIDESLIERQLSSGLVNADFNRRGIDLEEADGAQDIGRDPGLLDNSPSFGTAFDFWWSDNDYRVITENGSIDLNPDNRFGPDTYPNNNSNSGAKSYFELYDFSDQGMTASFRIRKPTLDLGFEQIFSITQPIGAYSSFNENYPTGITFYEGASDTSVVIVGDFNIFFFDHLNPVPDSGFYPASPDHFQQPLILDEVISGTASNSGNTIGLRSYTPGSVSENWTSDPDKNQGFISSQNGSLIDLDFTSNSVDPTNGSIIPNNSGFEFRSEVVDGKFVGINGQTVTFFGEDLPDQISTATERLFGGTIKTNGSNLYYLFEDGAFSIIDPSKDESKTEIFDEDKAEWPAIVGTGEIYWISKTENAILGFNLTGAQLNNTPVFAPDSVQFIGTPLVADITGDDVQDLLVIGQDRYSTNIYAYQKDGSPIEGFPLYVGGGGFPSSEPFIPGSIPLRPIHPGFYQNILYAISPEGDFKAWRFENFTTSEWPSKYGKNPYNKVSAEIDLNNNSSGTFTVLNSKETYNWPNPADDFTHLRFELEAPGGTVDITIIDFSGHKVYEQTVSSTGGSPQEIRISTLEWASGPYFAMFKATVNGRSESKLVKIAVTH